MDMYRDSYPCSDIPLDKFIVIDVETTGVSHKHDAIIELSAVKYENFNEISVFSTLVNPQRQISDVITSLTGISQDDLDAAPTWETVMADFVTFLEDLPLVGHNICSFDRLFIEDALGYELHVPIIDTLFLVRQAFPQLPNHKLNYLNTALGIGAQRAHRALDDVRTTFAVFVACLREIANEGSVPIIDCDCSKPFDALDAEHSESRKRKYRDQVNVKSIAPTCTDIDSSCPLCGKNIVFTGTLSLPRADAMQIAVNAGAILKTSISKTTDYLVVGIQDKDIVGDDGLSSKEERALALNESGKANIKMISEQEFLTLSQQSTPVEETEQLGLLENPPDEDWVYDILKESLVQVIQNNNVSVEKLILKKGKSYSSVFYDTQMVFRICCRDKHHYFSVSNMYANLIPECLVQNITADGKSEGFTKFAFDSSVDGIIQYIEFLSSVLDVAIDALPKEFDCCSYYEECSNAKQCINPNPRTATGCGYRRIMKKGRFFYGKNRNVD